MSQTITDRDTDLEILEMLGEELTRRGYLTMLVTGASRPRLEVLDRTSPDRYGTVLCARDGSTGDGDRWLWWSWADRIAPATDPARAADVINRDMRRLTSAA